MNMPTSTAIKEDYRKDAFDMLESALQWFQSMESYAQDDIYNSHYGSFFVTAHDEIRRNIKEMIDDYKAVKNLDYVIRDAYYARKTLEADLLGGVREAKPYWQYVTNIEINLKSAKFYFVFDERYNPIHKEGNIA